MKFRFAVSLCALAVVMSAAGKDKATVSPMDIADYAAETPDLSTLAAAMKAANVVDTLKGPGPFTVFAPTNDAFGKLPAGTVGTLLKPENQDTLSKILTYHVVAGKITSKQLIGLIKKSHGKAALKTVEGATLTASLQQKKVILTDEKGGTATVTKADTAVKNGMIHFIDTVLMPN